MIFNFIIQAVATFAANVGAVYAAAVNNVALLAHSASFKSLSIATSVKIGKAVVGGLIAYGLYQLGRPDTPKRAFLRGRKHFRVSPNPDRIVVYGKCWLSPAVVSQCSTDNHLYLICAVADHKLKKLADLKIYDQPFLTNQEKTDLQDNRWVEPGDGGTEISDWRKLVVDRKSGTGLTFAYGFKGEELQDQLGEGAKTETGTIAKAMADGGADLQAPWRAGTGQGSPVDKLNFRMVGTSWMAVGIKRTPLTQSNYWNQIPNISVEVERGNETLDVKFLWPKVEIGRGLGDFTRSSTEAVKLEFWSALGVPNETSGGEPISFKTSLEYEDGDSDAIKAAKDKLYENIVTEYYTEGNAALCTVDFLKRYTAYKEPICGEIRIDRESALEAARVCEEYTDVEGNSTPLTADGAMPINRPDSVLTQLTMAMNSGAIVESGGIRYIHAGAHTPPTMDYTDDEILVDNSSGRSQLSFSRTSDISRRTSLMNVHYIDEEGLQRMAGVRAVDFQGNLLKRTTISGMELNFIKNRKQAEQVARIAIDRQWNSATVIFSLLNTNKIPRPYDMIQMNVDAFDTFSQKNFRVTGVSNSLGGVVKVQGVWEDDDLYTATEASDYTVLPTPDPEPGPTYFIFDDYGVAPIGHPISTSGDSTIEQILIHPTTANSTEKNLPGDTKTIGATNDPANGDWGDTIRIN